MSLMVRINNIILNEFIILQFLKLNMYYFTQTFYYSNYLVLMLIIIKFIMICFYAIEDLNIYTSLHYYPSDHHQNYNHLPLLIYHTSCLFFIIHIIEMLLFHL
jgi:hypothetical protein